MQNRAERSKNLRRAFAVKRPAQVASRRILLIDDVMTTGATADECARTLIAAGARRVDVLTLARAV
jgi:predicted amidophosphoribosyltransferase